MYEPTILIGTLLAIEKEIREPNPWIDFETSKCLIWLAIWKQLRKNVNVNQA